MRTCLHLLLAVSLVPLPAPAAEVCTPSESTVAETRCVMEALQAKDRELEKALVRVASEARQVPSETFQTLWRDNLTGFYEFAEKPTHEPVFHRHQWISGSKRRIGGYQSRKQPDFGIVGLSARHWLRPIGHTSGQRAVHAASIPQCQQTNQYARTPSRPKHPRPSQSALATLVMRTSGHGR
ncbi:hypothetical protein [Synechococcus sp. CBW1002]|uniref:hypothetical protein n=1 Tax=Synechococcus sp. CBW1002 TaxID=1353134 RepID=UPI001E401B1C|nr:hypothetical protein [Synechococcus sp. CBW1002]